MKGRNLGLDVLRCLAIVLVLGRHVHLPTQIASTYGLGFMEVWQRGGWIGVDLFFVLSGYLVSGLLFKEHLQTGKVSPGRFLIRRGFKIYPAFWVLLAVSLSAKLLLGSSQVTSTEMWAEVLFLQNYLGGIWPHTWSLAVEEHFYFALALTMPLLLKAPGKKGIHAMPWIFLIAALACLAGRYRAAYRTEDFVFTSVINPTHLRIDSMMCGVLVSYLEIHHRLFERIAAVPSVLLAAVGGACFLPAFFFTLEGTPWLVVYGPTLFYLGAALWVIVAVRIRDSQSLLLRTAGFIGGASYSIYLWHIPMTLLAMRLFMPAHEPRFALYLATYLLGSAIAGIVLARIIEVPFLSLRDRLYPSRSAGSRRHVSPGEMVDGGTCETVPATE